MPFVPTGGGGSIPAKYAVHVWRDDDDEAGVESFYHSEAEARVEFDRVEAGGQYAYGGLYMWNSIESWWECLDAWPADWTGFDEEDDEEEE